MKWILCECGDFVDGNTFRDYIKTSISPSTSTFGHSNCGLIFDFIDREMPKRYSSRKELNGIATKLADKFHMSDEDIAAFLLKVFLLKSDGMLSDADILRRALKDMNLE